MRTSRVMATLLLMVCFATAVSMESYDQVWPRCIAADPVPEEGPELPDAVPVSTEKVGEITTFTFKDVFAFLWKQMNTPAGLLATAAFLSFVAGKIFLKKPKWKLYYDEYKGHLVAAIKFAEKKIPDGTENKAAARADAALNYAMGVIAAGKSQGLATDKDALAQALHVVHNEAEMDKTL